MRFPLTVDGVPRNVVKLAVTPSGTASASRIFPLGFRGQRKLARKAGFPAATPEAQPTPTPAEATAPPVAITGIPEPGLPFPSLSSISPAQLAANRANAQLSTGPATVAGRAISSQNRTSHGLARHNGAFILLATEDPNGFEALKVSLAAEYQPSTETESILVTTMAESHWLANRAATSRLAVSTPKPVKSATKSYSPSTCVTKPLTPAPSTSLSTIS
jgi:hypothetical protein